MGPTVAVAAEPPHRRPVHILAMTRRRAADRQSRAPYFRPAPRGVPPCTETVCCSPPRSSPSPSPALASPAAGRVRTARRRPRGERPAVGDRRLGPRQPPPARPSPATPCTSPRPAAAARDPASPGAEGDESCFGLSGAITRVTRWGSHRVVTRAALPRRPRTGGGAHRARRRPRAHPPRPLSRYYAATIGLGHDAGGARHVRGRRPRCWAPSSPATCSGGSPRVVGRPRGVRGARQPRRQRCPTRTRPA